MNRGRAGPGKRKETQRNSNQFSGPSSQLRWQVREGPPWCTVSLGTQQMSNFTSDKSPLKQGSPTLTHLLTSAWEDPDLGDLPCRPAVISHPWFMLESFFKLLFFLFIHLFTFNLFIFIYSLFFNLFIYSLIHAVLVAACGISVFTVALRIFSCSMWDLVPCPGIEPGPPALEAWSLSHQTTREVPTLETGLRSTLGKEVRDLRHRLEEWHFKGSRALTGHRCP